MNAYLVGQSFLCSECEYPMFAEVCERGDKFAHVFCRTHDCSKKDKAFRFDFPRVILSEVRPSPFASAVRWLGKWLAPWETAHIPRIPVERDQVRRRGTDAAP